MPYQDEERTYGPRVAVANGAPGIEWAVVRTYKAQAKGSRVWSGMLTMFFMGKPFMDIECALMQSNQRDEGSFVSWPQRGYPDVNGQTKYMNVVWMHDRNVAGAAAEAVRQAIGLAPVQSQQGEDFDPLQDM